MEHDDRAPVATFYAEAAFAVSHAIQLGEAAAHHARVKRLAPRDRVRLTNGAGTIASGDIAAIRSGSMDVVIHELAAVARPPEIHLRVPVADRDRMLWLAEKATELGVTTWQAVRFHRSASVSPRGEGPAFAEKVRTRMISAIEQSGGAWLPRALPNATLDALDSAGSELLLVLDVNGQALLSVVNGAERPPVLLVGPEGGIDPAESLALANGGWMSVRLASTTLRFETAGMAAVAAVRSAQLLREG